MNIKEWLKSDEYQEYKKYGIVNGVRITPFDIIAHAFNTKEEYVKLANELIDENYYKLFVRRTVNYDYPNTQRVLIRNTHLKENLERSGLLMDGEYFLYFTHGFNDTDQREMSKYADDILKLPGADLNGVAIDVKPKSQNPSDLMVGVLNDYNDITYISIYRYITDLLLILEPEIFKTLDSELGQIIFSNFMTNIKGSN